VTEKSYCDYQCIRTTTKVPVVALVCAVVICRLLFVDELNSFVIVVLPEADTVDAVIVSGVLAVEAEPAKRCRSFVFSKRQEYKITTAITESYFGFICGDRI